MKPSVIIDRVAALAALPPAYGMAIRLREAGHDDESIASALGLERESVETLLQLAEAKVTSLMSGASKPETEGQVR